VRRLSLVAAALAAAACEAPSGPELTVDNGRFCPRIGIEVRDDAVLPGWEVHALAVERFGGDSAWALATDPDGRLMLQPWPEGPGLDLSSVGEPDDFTLIPGALDGQTWLVLDRSDRTQVWRLDRAQTGSFVAGPPLLDWPSAGMWTRRLVFVAGEPYLLAVPQLADASLIELSLARLAAATLVPEVPAPIEFWRPTCPEGQDPCVPGLSGDMLVEALHSTEAGSSGISATLIATYSREQTEVAVYKTVVASLELRSGGPGQPPGYLRRDHVRWSTVGELRVSPGLLAADASGLYVIAGQVPVSDDAPSNLMSDYLIRASRAEDSLDEDLINLLPKSRASQLLQIGDRVGLGQTSGREWCVAPIDGMRVDVDTQGCLPLDVDAVVRAAGRGQFLVRSELGARRVIIDCLSDAPESE